MGLVEIGVWDGVAEVGEGVRGANVEGESVEGDREVGCLLVGWPNGFTAFELLFKNVILGDS
eukprot:32536-Amorphochlora_amoeboformis.AAC.1